MKARVLLITPTALDLNGKPIKKDLLYLPGLTLLSLAAVTPDTVDLTLVNETIMDIPFDEHWDLVGLSGMGSGLQRAWEIADQFRSRKIPVVIGGIAASLAPLEWSLEHADHIITGEAEETWPAFLSDFLAGRARTVYKMASPPDIRTIPMPRYDLLHKGEKGLWRPVQATRGCPFPCEFCSIQAFFNRGYRKKPVERVIENVRLAKKSGSRYITFIDDNIGVDWNYFAELMEALIPEKIYWASQCSIHIADKPDMLDLAFKSGCRILSFGIESVNSESVNSIGKNFNRPQEYRRSLKNVRNAGIIASTEMIVGMEGDTEETFENTYRFLVDNLITLPRVYILTPVPGTKMYEQFESEKRIFDYNLANYNGGKAVFRPRNFDSETLDKNYWKLYRKIYSHPCIIRRMRGIPRQALNLGAVVYGTNLHYRSHVLQKITPGIV